MSRLISKGDRAWIRGFEMAHKLGYSLRDSRIFAMAYEKGYTNGYKVKRGKGKR